MFDKIECKKSITDYVKNNLILKIHTLEVLEVEENAIKFYQPFNDSKRKVNVAD